MEESSAVARRVRALRDWTLTRGRQERTMKAFVAAAATHLSSAGLPFDRMWAGTMLLHPQAAAYFWIWERDGDGVVEHEISYTRFALLEESDSPILRLRKGASQVRARLGPKDPRHELSDIESLRAKGYTDFFALPLTFRGEFVGAFTWATRAPGGFTDEDIEVFRAVSPALEAVAEPLAREMATATLLRTYLGTNAGARVLSGQVRRGDGQTIRAAIWFCDLRGFTRLSGAVDRDVLLALLNDSFEVIVEGLTRHGGEVLKFMGDGVLGVFAETADDDDDGARACRAAAEATADIVRRLEQVHETRRRRGLPVAALGVGLHHGDVMYGNIGAPGRLDFTVIGSAVNLASRIESQCSRLGRTALASEAFATRCDGSVTPLEAAVLKGVDEPVQLFALELDELAPKG